MEDVQCTDNVKEHNTNEDNRNTSNDINSYCISVNVVKIIDTMQKKIECAQCRDEISNRDFQDTLKKNLSALDEVMPYICHERKIKKKLSNILNNKIKMTIHCSSVLKIICDMVTEMFIIRWSNYVNKLLNGSIKETSNNIIFFQAQRCALRYSRNKKKYEKV